MRKPKHRGIKSPSPYHTARTWWSWDSCWGLFTPSLHERRLPAVTTSVKHHVTTVLGGPVLEGQCFPAQVKSTRHCYRQKTGEQSLQERRSTAGDQVRKDTPGRGLSARPEPSLVFESQGRHMQAAGRPGTSCFVAHLPRKEILGSPGS